MRLYWYCVRLSRLRATAPTSTKGSILRESSLRKGYSPNFLELRKAELRRITLPRTPLNSGRMQEIRGG